MLLLSYTLKKRFILNAYCYVSIANTKNVKKVAILGAICYFCKK